EDNPVEDSQVIVEEVSIFPVEEQQEVPPGCLMEDVESELPWDES
ncbi:ASPH isoform 21, partial [Pongo abelii]